MNGIIRKKLLALFSAVGLAGSATAATAQVLKGAEPGQKKESKIKLDKNKQESNAGKGQAAIKYDKNKTPADAASKDAIKLNKANSENTASKDAIIHKDRKAGTDAANVKQKSTIKLTNATTEKNAAQHEANKKANQASPK
jgi:hypothetical protein